MPPPPPGAPGSPETPLSYYSDRLGATASGSGPPPGSYWPTTPELAGPASPTPVVPTAQKSRKGLKIGIISLVILLLLGGVGSAAYFLTRPKPTITVTSDYKVGSTPAGAAGTAFHVNGSGFSGNSSITFLLDGQPAPGTQPVQSDGSGNVTATLNVSPAWGMGEHTLTAKDASGSVTQTGVLIQIVCQGCANTPGPNGAPSNSQTFNLNITIQSQDFGTMTETLHIAGNGDSGGTVCQDRDDGHTSYTTSQRTLTFSDGSSFPYTETSISQCSGTYVGGHLNYIETTVTDTWDFGNGTQCTTSPHKAQVLTGDFSDAKTISGKYSADGVTLQGCTRNGSTVTVNSDSGTFTGTLSQ
jgi:hypothetical protein